MCVFVVGDCYSLFGGGVREYGVVAFHECFYSFLAACRVCYSKEFLFELVGKFYLSKIVAWLFVVADGGACESDAEFGLVYLFSVSPVL